MSFKNNFVGARVEKWGLDTIGASVGLLLALVLFPLRFSVSQLHVHTIPVVIGIASGLYLVLKRYEYSVPKIDEWRASARTSHVASMTVLVGLASMVFVGSYTGGRTVPFFGVTALVAALILAQIFFLRRSALDPAALLAQIVAFALVVRGTALVMTPGLIGVDSWVHLHEYAASIRQTGQLSAIAESHYYGAPLYHLLVIAAAEAFNSTLRTALYVTLGIVMPLSILLIYFSARFFLPVRWALFAAAAFGVADHVIRWGIHVIPTSMGLVFFMGVFYGVARLYATRETPGLYALVLFFAVATIYTHHISTFVVLVFLAAGAAAQLYVRLFAPRMAGGDGETGSGSVNFLLLLLIVLPLTLVNWSNSPRVGGSFLGGMLDTARTSIETVGFLDLASSSGIGNEVIASMAVSIPLSIQLVDLLGFSILLFVTLVGSFTVLQREHLELLPLSWINSTAGMLFVVLGTPLFGLYFLIPGRWYAFAYVPMVILAAFGLWYLESNMPTRQLVAVLVVLALVFPGAMLVNHKATHDNPVGDDYFRKFAFSESELVAAETIATLHPEGVSLHADHPYQAVLRDAEGAPAESLELGDDGTISDSHVVYRRYQTEGLTQVAYGTSNVGVKLSQDDVCRPGMDVVYTIGDVRYCRSGAT